MALEVDVVARREDAVEESHRGRRVRGRERKVRATPLTRASTAMRSEGICSAASALVVLGPNGETWNLKMKPLVTV